VPTTPEPAAWLALALVAPLLGAVAWRRRLRTRRSVR
jgi:PEP-CTERM motif